MQAESKRIFIKELPDNCNETDVRKKFSKFGEVSSVEIKQRKAVGNQNITQNFAFVNINIDAVSLQKCFQDISNIPWKGKHVEIQLAKESFLDRLKKEREQTQNNEPQEKRKFNEDNIRAFNDKKRKLDEDVTKQAESLNNVSNGTTEKILIESVNLEEVYEGIKVTNNKNVKHTNKIESFGFEPIIKIEPKKPKSKDPKRAEADQKRINSMLEMKKSYHQQKFAIKRALSKIDSNPTKPEEKPKEKKIIEEEPKQSLFEDDGSEDEYNVNLNLKEQFQGKKGQELYKLQTKFNNDDRFNIDERFIENDHEENAVDDVDDGENKKQLEILGEVLGTKEVHVRSKEEKTGKLMLRFDPSQPSHSKYEIIAKKEKKRKEVQNEQLEPKKHVVVKESIPETSKEKFFQVINDIQINKSEEKESYGLSLLSMLGKNYDDKNDEEEAATDILKPQMENGKNPFKYDSSTDEEDDSKEDANKDLEKITASEDQSSSQKVDLGPKKLWTEPFFFRKDDYRLQEGFDFMKRMGLEDSTNFNEVRKEVRSIAKHKIKLSTKKDKRFEKKLGGAKRNFKKKRNFRKKN